MEFSVITTGILFLDRLALAILIGVGAAGVWLLTDSKQRDFFIPSFKRLLDSAVVILIFTTAAVLMIRTAALADLPLSEAAANRFIIIPAIINKRKLEATKNSSLLHTQPTKLFHRVLHVDTLVFVTVIAIAVFLATISPPNH